MAIPQGRMSTVVVEGVYLPPKDRISYPLAPYEIGPYALGDTTRGLIYQVWSLVYDTGNGEMTLIPEVTGIPEVVLTVLDVIHVSFTFDQAGRITIAYTTTNSSYLYWYDTDLGTTTTTDLGVGVVTPTVALDDKRITQNDVSDILLWFTRVIPGGYSLFNSLQRERYLIEYLMATGLSAGNIRKAGMSSETRVQLTLSTSIQGLPVAPTLPTPAEALAILKAASASGHLDFTLLPHYPFETIFGVDINDPDFTSVVPTGSIMFVTSVGTDMLFSIEDSGDATEAIMLVGHAQGVARGAVSGSLYYVNLPLAGQVTIQADYPMYIAIASDTGTLKITKETP